MYPFLAIAKALARPLTYRAVCLIAIATCYANLTHILKTMTKSCRCHVEKCSKNIMILGKKNAVIVKNPVYTQYLISCFSLLFFT